MYKGGPTRVWRLKGPLHGSRDSPRVWYESIRRFMLNVELLGAQGFVIDDSAHAGRSVGDVTKGVSEGFS